MASGRLRTAGAEGILLWSWASFHLQQTSQGTRIKGNEHSSLSSSIYKHAWMGNTHIEHWKILLFINGFERKHFCLIYCVENLEISPPKPTEIGFLFARKCGRTGCRGSLGLVEKDILTVEIAQSKFRNRDSSKGRRSKLSNEVGIFRGIHRTSKRTFLVRIQDRTIQTLIPLVKKHVLQGSVIHSDKSQAY